MAGPRGDTSCTSPGMHIEKQYQCMGLITYKSPSGLIKLTSNIRPTPLSLHSLHSKDSEDQHINFTELMPVHQQEDWNAGANHIRLAILPKRTEARSSLIL